MKTVIPIHNYKLIKKNTPCTTTSGLGIVENLLFNGSISPAARNPWRKYILQ